MYDKSFVIRDGVRRGGDDYATIAVSWNKLWRWYEWSDGNSQSVGEGQGVYCLDDIFIKIKDLTKPEKNMINEIITISKLIVINPEKRRRSFIPPWHKQDLVTSQFWTATNREPIIIASLLLRMKLRHITITTLRVMFYCSLTVYLFRLWLLSSAQNMSIERFFLMLVA